MSKPKFYTAIKNAANNTLELHFLDYISDGFDWNTWEYKSMVQDTIKQIKDANPTKIRIVVNSLGGDVMIGLAIYNYLKSLSGVDIESENIGFAASIASVMMMAAGNVKMAKNSFMIIHAAWMGAVGNASELRQQADNLDKVTNELADIYAQKSGKHDAKYFTDLWANGDVWLNAQEAYDLGLVNEITNEVAIQNAIDVRNYGFKNIPAALMNQAEIQAPEASQQSFLQSLKSDIMNLFNSLKASITGAKENQESTVEAKDEILNLVESVLTPFAQKFDELYAELKPAEKPEDKKDTTVVENKVVETPENKEENEAAKLEKRIKDLEAIIANGITTPTPGVSDKQKENLLAKVNVEYGD